MGRPGKRPARLSALAQDAGFSQDGSVFNLQRPLLPTFTPQDETRVEKVLSRGNGLDIKKSFRAVRRRFSRASLTTEDYTNEITWKFKEMYDAGCTAGEALLMVEMGADINTIPPKPSNVSRKSRGVFQEKFRNDVFTRAIEAGNVNVVNVLADHADQINLNDGLKIALLKKNLQILTILMLVGADPANCQAEVNIAVDSESSDIVPILCGGVHPLTRHMATNYLYQMVQHDDLIGIHSLLRNGASADADSPSALLCAITSGKLVYVAALCQQAQYPPSPAHLARGVRCAFKNGHVASSEGKHMIEILLAAGAQGDGVDEAVVLATTMKLSILLRLLLDYTEFNIKYTPRAITAAMENADLGSFSLLLSTVEYSATLDESLLALQKPPLRNSVPPALRKEMTSMILRKGATKQGLSRGLEAAIHNLEVDIICLLINAGATVNSIPEPIMVMAVRSESMNLLSTLIKSKPVITKCFDTALVSIAYSVGGIDLPLRFEKIKALIDAGGKVVNADESLDAAVRCSEKAELHYNIMKFLLDVNAKVDVGKEGCLMVAVEASDWRAVEILSKAVKQGSDLETVFTASNKLPDLDARYKILQSLLEAGAQGTYVTKTLLDVLERIPREKRFSRLLVGKGKVNVNLSQGKVISQAVMHQDVELLRMLMGCQPTTENLSRALKKALILEEGPTRLEICQTLLKAGAKGEEVDNALIRAAVSTPTDMDLAKLLVSFKASIDHKTGMVLKIALENEDLELLKLLLQRPAQSNTIVRVMSQAMAMEEKNRFPAMSSLLSTATQIPRETLGGLLVEALGDAKDLRLFHLLLAKGASVNVGSLEIFQKAISLNQDSIMKALLDAGVTDVTLRQVFAYAWQAKGKVGFSQLATIASDRERCKIVKLDEYLIKAVEEVPCSTPLVTFLLQLQASVEYSSNRCIQIAVLRADISLLRLLMKQIDSKQTHFRTVRRAMQWPEVWDIPNILPCIPVLLGNNPGKAILDECLLIAANHYSTRVNAPAILDRLLSYGASCDYRDGEALEIAARAGNLRLVERLLDAHPSRPAVTNAFPYILDSKADTATILDLIKVFTFKTRLKLDLIAKHKELLPVLFMCVSRTFDRTEIFKALLQAGVSVSQTAQITLDRDSGAENTSILLYIAHTASWNDIDIMKLLINKGANVNFTAPLSHLTPLLAASRLGGHASITRALISCGANVSARDARGKTPLFYATAAEDLVTMQLLIAAGAPFNDGSLYEALRKGHYEAISLLLRSKHDPNFGSSAYLGHQGPLEVFIRTSSVFDTPENSSLAQQIFKLLADNGANFNLRRDGKSLFLMSLDQEHAENIVRPLATFLGSTIDDDINFYQEGGYNYSPLAYVMLNKSKCPKFQKPQVEKILRQCGCIAIKAKQDHRQLH